MFFPSQVDKEVGESGIGIEVREDFIIFLHSSESYFKLIMHHKRIINKVYYTNILWIVLKKKIHSIIDGCNLIALHFRRVIRMAIYLAKKPVK